MAGGCQIIQLKRKEKPQAIAWIGQLESKGVAKS